MKTKKIEIGSLFEVILENNKKAYFQYIGQDMAQLNSDVIKVFAKRYDSDYAPKSEEIVNDEVEFYAHTMVKTGHKLGLWHMVDIVDTKNNEPEVWFRVSLDYGKKAGTLAILRSFNWCIWKLGDLNFTNIGELKKEYEDYYIGLVINPNGIFKLLHGEKYPLNYPK